MARGYVLARVVYWLVVMLCIAFVFARGYVVDRVYDCSWLYCASCL